MAGLRPSRAERVALCDLFDAIGPDAPTRCAGWTTADLATHLLVRERYPLAAIGLVWPSRFGDRLETTYERVLAGRPYAAIVDTVRRGPPAPLRPFDAAMNLVEYFVHHEDVRRGGAATDPRPAAETADLDDALWRTLRTAGRLQTRTLPVGLDLVRDDGAVLRVHRGAPTATLTGRPGELVLYLAGRRRVAQVQLGGVPAAVTAVQDAAFGV